MARGDDNWIDDEELEDVNVKWPWSNFDGRDPMNGDGNYNFTVTLPEAQALDLLNKGWTGVKENPPREEGDPSEWTLRIKVSYMYTPPKIYLIKNERKFRVTEIENLADIRRDMTDRVDVIITPSRWVQGSKSGVTAYVKELYAEIRESRFSSRYADYEEI